MYRTLQPQGNAELRSAFCSRVAAAGNSEPQGASKAARRKHAGDGPGRPVIDEQPPKGWYSRGYLPHMDSVGAIQHVTFHLADSLPVESIERLLAQVSALPKAAQQRERREQLHALLDVGYGSCFLRDERAATVVSEALLFGDGRRYRLLAWVVMPNHVHALVRTQAHWPLGKIVQTWKRHTSKCFDAIGVSSAKPYWQREYWDRFMRSDRQQEIVSAYIEFNPVKAGLVERPEHWRWGSAGWSVATPDR